MTSDRDAFALVDDTTSVLRLVNGGVNASPLITPRAEAVVRNRRLMALRHDLALPGLEGMRLPLDRHRVRVTLRDWRINLGPSLWALLGEPAPNWPVPAGQLPLF